MFCDIHVFPNSDFPFLQNTQSGNYGTIFTFMWTFNLYNSFHVTIRTWNLLEGDIRPLLINKQRFS